MAIHGAIIFYVVKLLFHSSQNPTRKLAARTFIQLQYLNYLPHLEVFSAHPAMGGKQALKAVAFRRGTI